MDPIIKNSDIERYIEEYVHNKKYREVLKLRMIDGLTFEAIADTAEISTRHAKTIVYKYHDKLLFIMKKDGVLRF